MNLATHYFFLKVTSYYGLLSKTPILNPVATGKRIKIILHSACMIAAYPARSREEVNHFSSSWIWITVNILKAGTIQYYMERPQFLAYHEKSFHSMDLELCQCSQVSFGSFDEILSSCNINLHCNHDKMIMFDSRHSVDLVV